MTIYEVFEAYDSGKLESLPPDVLHVMHRCCSHGSLGDTHSQEKARNAARMIETILQKKTAERLQGELVGKYDQLATETGLVRDAISKLPNKHHWTATPVFWMTLGILVFAVIAAIPVIRELIPRDSHDNKAASSPLPQSHSITNSQPTSPTTKTN